MKASEIIKRLKNEHGLTQTEIAEFCKIGQSSVSKILNGKETPNLKFSLNLVKLAKRKKIKVKIDDFVT